MSLKNIKGLKMKPTELLHPEQRGTSKAYLVRELNSARQYSLGENRAIHIQQTAPAACCSSGLKKTLSFTMRLFNSGYFSIPYAKVDKNRNYGA